MEPANCVDSFQLSQADTAFSSRSQDVFSCLDSIEAKHNAFEKKRNDSRSDYFKPDPTEEPIACRESFKAPKGMPRKSRVPDYKARPDKWKRYNLSDVSLDQLSDKSNRSTALAFLNSMKKHESNEMGNDEEDNSMICDDEDTDGSRSSFASVKKHVFKTPLKQTSCDKSQPEHDQLSKTSNSQILVQQPNEDGQIDESPCEASDDLSESKLDDLHFHGKLRRVKSENIRHKASNNDDDEDDDDDDKDSEVQKTENSEKNESDESDEFGDCAVEGEDDDDAEGIYTKLLATEHEEMKDKDDYSDDEDVNKRAEVLSSIESNVCVVLSEDKRFAKSTEDGASLDDLDSID